eukprot:scaffold97273_cov67-Phaeocystis_antarctica.AAC.4
MAPRAGNGSATSCPLDPPACPARSKTAGTAVLPPTCTCPPAIGVAGCASGGDLAKRLGDRAAALDLERRTRSGCSCPGELDPTDRHTLRPPPDICRERLGTAWLRAHAVKLAPGPSLVSAHVEQKTHVRSAVEWLKKLQRRADRHASSHPAGADTLSSLGPVRTPPSLRSSAERPPSTVP